MVCEDLLLVYICTSKKKKKECALFMQQTKHCCPKNYTPSLPSSSNQFAACVIVPEEEQEKGEQISNPYSTNEFVHAGTAGLSAPYLLIEKSPGMAGCRRSSSARP